MLLVRTPRRVTRAGVDAGGRLARTSPHVLPRRRTRLLACPSCRTPHLPSPADLDGRTSSEFCALVKELSGPGVISGLQTFKWSFPKVEMPHESYEGLNARCRYFIRVTVSRAGYAVSNVVKEQDFLVQNVEAVSGGHDGGGG